MPRRPLLAIVGAANAPSQDSADFSPVGLMAEAAACALEETSLTKADIDGLFFDIDVFQIYDSFTIANIVTLEDLGFCAKGEGGPFVEGGTIRPGGKLAVNTSGGGLSYRHPGMLGMVLLLEAMAQLRGEAGRRQVDGAETALVHGLGAIHMSGATAVLGGPGWRPDS